MTHSIATPHTTNPQRMQVHTAPTRILAMLHPIPTLRFTQSNILVPHPSPQPLHNTPPQPQCFHTKAFNPCITHPFLTPLAVSNTTSPFSHLHTLPSHIFSYFTTPSSCKLNSAQFHKISIWWKRRTAQRRNIWLRNRMLGRYVERVEWGKGCAVQEEVSKLYKNEMLCWCEVVLDVVLGVDVERIVRVWMGCVYGIRRWGGMVVVILM